jgi:hypothetical protein
MIKRDMNYELNNGYCDQCRPEPNQLPSVTVKNSVSVENIDGQVLEIVDYTGFHYNLSANGTFVIETCQYAGKTYPIYVSDGRRFIVVDNRTAPGDVAEKAKQSSPGNYIPSNLRPRFTETLRNWDISAQNDNLERLLGALNEAYVMGQADLEYEQRQAAENEF